MGLLGRFKPRLPRLSSPDITVYWAKGTLPDGRNSFMFATGGDLDEPVVLINLEPFVMPEEPDYRAVGTVAINLGGRVLNNYAGAEEIALVDANDRHDEDLGSKPPVPIPDAWKGQRLPAVDRDDDELKRFLKSTV